MPYIPKKHEKYRLLPLQREYGGEVFDYPSELMREAIELLGSHKGIFPYGFKSYEEYDRSVENLIAEHSNDAKLVEKLTQLLEEIHCMNRKEEWSVLRYIGPTDDHILGLTCGKIYYWPAQISNPVFGGVIDDEEFTSYLHPTDAELWEILEDPTGMAYRTIYKENCKIGEQG